MWRVRRGGERKREREREREKERSFHCQESSPDYLIVVVCGAILRFLNFIRKKINLTSSRLDGFEGMHCTRNDVSHNHVPSTVFLLPVALVFRQLTRLGK